MRRLKQALRALGVTGDIHFLLFTVGLANVLSVVGTAALSVASALPWWALLGIYLGVVLMLIALLSPVVGAIGRRVAHQPQPPSAGGATWSPDRGDPVEWLRQKHDEIDAENARWEQAEAARKARAESIGQETDHPAVEAVTEAKQPDEPQWWRYGMYDIGELALTESDLDGALQRATSFAREYIASDASLEFRSVELQPHLAVSFAVWSETAKRHSRVTTYLGRGPLGDYQSNGYSPPQRQPFVGHGKEPYRGDSDEPPWLFDDRWKQLLTEAWYRLASTDARLTLFGPKVPIMRVDPGVPIPAGWHVCRMGALQEEFCHAFRGDELVEFASAPSGE